MALPRILVFDDLAGWLPDHRARRCKHLLLRDVTDGNSQAEEKSCLADAVFHPAQIRKGNRIENSIDAALARVREGDRRKEDQWALVLLDLQFDSGEVANGELDSHKNWPEKSNPEDPFGLSLLASFAETWPDLQRPGRTAIPVAALSSSRTQDLEQKLNDLGNLGYLQTSEDNQTPFAQRRRLSDLLFHFGLFHDDTMNTLDDNGRIKQLPREKPMVGNSPALLHALRAARQAATSLAPCLLQGPIGSGKGEFAKLIHELSSRSGPLKQRDCASLPETLLELELFGYAPKAALQNQNPKGKKGDFELADNGTLFLDELGAMTPMNQAKLLVTLQEGRVNRLGAEDGTPVNVRVLGATNLDLERAVAEGKFNDALYSRLHSLMIRVPTLNERSEDVPALFKKFVESETEKIKGETGKHYPDETLQILQARDWRFNVRELENLAKKIAVERRYSKVIAPNDVR
jgi:transcriptional regulator with AAA-type ATPase domain